MNIKSNHQLWLNQYEEIQRSGLSIRSWAIQNNLSSSSISKRIYRLRQMGLIPEGEAQTSRRSKCSGSSFVEITASVSTSTSTSTKSNSADIACRIEFANKNASSAERFFFRPHTGGICSKESQL